MKYTITPSFREYCYERFPALSQKISYQYLFRYLCFGCFVDEETNRLIIGAKHLYQMQPQFQGTEYDRRVFNARAFLSEFRDAVLPGLTWDADPWGVKALQVVTTGFDDEFLARLALELETVADPTASAKQVDFLDGAKFNSANRDRIRHAEAADYQARRSEFQLNPTQESILTYLEERTCSYLFPRKFQENEKAIWEAIAALPAGEPQLIAKRQIHSILQSPQVYYKPSVKGNTCRLHPANESVPSLKSTVRKAFCKGWTEVDLASSQFAILAAMLEAPIAKAFVASGESLWQALYFYTHESREPIPSDIKRAFKSIIYSICYGKSLVHDRFYHERCRKSGMPVQQDLTEMATAAGVPQLLKHPMLMELLSLRKKWFAFITKQGGHEDAWGKWQAVGKDRWVGQIAATVIQSIEMEIIAGIFDVAREHGESYKFQIVFFQHDGATISFNNKRDMFIAKAHMQEAVQKRAEKINKNIKATLEFTDL